ncbi:MAG: hypothetical protein PHC64_00065 [Candidatus Gastranaerophilales bacterium]|nr:hypothetical protein [Candidatus Gastranaerophilales bacterium]
MYVNKCTKCGSEFETKNPKRVICPNCLYPDKKMALSADLDLEREAEDSNQEFQQENHSGGGQQKEQNEGSGQQPSQQQFYNSYSAEAPQQRPYNQDRGGYQRPQQGGYNRPQQGGYNQDRGGYQRPQQGGYNRPQQGGYNQDRGGYQRPQQGGYNRPQGSGYNQDRSGYQRPQQGGYNRPQQGGYQRPQQGGYSRPQGGGYNQDRSGYQRSQQGGYNRPQQGGYNRPQGGYNRPSSGGFNRGGGRPQGNRINKPLLVSKEQLEQIELIYKTMLPLPNPDAHEVIGTKIGLEPRKVFFGINLIRQKMLLPKLPFPKRKLAISPDQMFAIQNLYEPLLPLPPIGCHKIIAAQLKIDEWRVHVGIGLIRGKLGLERWNQERADAPEEFKKQKDAKEAEPKKAKKTKEEKETKEAKSEKPKAKSKKTAKETEE